MTEIWWPSEYCTRYAFRCRAPYDGPPHYPNVPTLRVMDLAPGRLRPGRAKFWRRARENALGQWGGAGFDIRVLETRWGYEPGTITLDVCDTQDGSRGQADFGATVPVGLDGHQEPWPGVCWVHFDIEWFRDYFRGGNGGAVVKVLGHEFGHALGMGHNDDPRSLMNTYATGRATAEELHVARMYWL